MHKLLVSFIFIIIVNMTFAQNNNEAIFFQKKDQINRFHTIGDLESMKKGDLLTLYYSRVKEIMTVLPFLSLTNEAGVRLGDVGIKEDSNHLKTLKKTKEASEDALKSTKIAIEELVPYADTEKIIWTILYYEEIIKKMRIGVKGNF
ncbi:hypothetical protein [Aquimarina sp. MMG016]|uniref:hypothetical protein n=1 Tax=Aquimarina sp. MMG016 TaxID=2822690 RepID=UPI001B3A3181|nr:hypothetical protein [Aquimarina sp. MMG016]MBQ4818633.1 hypothetical protein [Aquimarina sp. MMG016]